VNDSDGTAGVDGIPLGVNGYVGMMPAGVAIRKCLGREWVRERDGDRDRRVAAASRSSRAFSYFAMMWAAVAVATVASAMDSVCRAAATASVAAFEHLMALSRDAFSVSSSSWETILGQSEFRHSLRILHSFGSFCTTFVFFTRFGVFGTTFVFFTLVVACT